MRVNVVSNARGWIEVTGPDRASWLQGMVSNDVVALKPGTGCYAAHLTPQGKVVADMVITADDASLWLMTEGPLAPKLQAALDRLLIMEDAQVRDASAEFATLSLWGDGVRRCLADWKGCEPPRHFHDWKDVDGCRVFRSEIGVDVRLPVSNLEKVSGELRDAGAIAASMDQWNVARVEAAVPRFGIDLDETTTLPELGDRAISYEKGCYVGQEVVAKIKYIGHVNRKLVGPDLGPSPILSPRTRIQRNGKDVGFVTSVVHSEKLGRTIALAIVQRGSETPDTKLDAGEPPHPAVVMALPFVPWPEL